MKANLCINEETLQGIHDFIFCDDKDNMLEHIDRIIEIAVKSKMAEEFQISEELGLLYDVKRLINVLPFSRHRENA